MRKIYLLLCLMCIGILANAQVAVTATAGTPAGAYTTVNDAFTAINAGTHQGDITITITGSTSEPATPVRLLKSTAPSSYTSVLIKPAGNATVNSAAAPAANRGMIEFLGADNVTINGDDPATGGARNLTFQMSTSTSAAAAIMFNSGATDGTDGAINNTVKNCVIVGSRSSATTTTTSIGIGFSGTSTTSLTGGAYGNTNMTVDNNNITRCYYGVYANGVSATYPNTGLVVKNNVMGSSVSADNIGRNGVFATFTAATAGAGSAIIELNDIRAGDYGTTGYSSNVSGVELGTTNAGAIVRKNNFHDISNQTINGWGAYGVYISSATANTGITIVNNFIRDMVASNYSTTSTQYENHGICVISAALGLVINHNTISLQTGNTVGTTTPPFTCGIYIGSATATVAQLLNNIIVNTQASTNAYGIYTSATLNISGGTVNNNAYYVTTGKIGYYNGVNQATLQDWSLATGKDAASISGNPGFTSATDLHIPNAASQLESAGALTATTGVTDDIDNQVRPGPAGSVNGGGSAPDIGADEFDGIKVDQTAPIITYTPILGDCGTGNKTVNNVTITDASGVATSGNTRPKIYYRKNGAGSYFSQYGTLSSGTGTNGTWSFTMLASDMGGLAAADYIQYYIIAQDIVSPTPNVSSNPNGATASNVNTVTADPTNPNVVWVGAALSGNYNIGASGAYTTLTKAINVYNASNCMGGPVTFTLADATYAGETFPITINNTYSTPATPLTIKPGAGQTVMFSGAVANAPLLRILGKYVIIDGSNVLNGTSRDLTISNTSATGPNAILIGSVGTAPVTNVTVKNTVLSNGVTSSALVISDAGTLGNQGYFNNISIQNNQFMKSYIGIYATAIVAPGNGSGLSIMGNDMTSTGGNANAFVGIYVRGADGATVVGNQIGNFEVAGAQDDAGILLDLGTTNTVVDRNNIFNLGYTGTSGYGGHGIHVNSGVTNANIRISNNMMSGLTGDGWTYTSATAATDNPIGIVLTSTQTGISLYYNSIRLEGNTLNQTNAMSMGIFLGTGSVANIVNNIIVNNLGLLAAIGYGSAGVYAQTSNAQFGTINYNDYYVAPTGSGGKYIGQIATTGSTSLANWQTASGQDANSINVLPSFVGTNDLHLAAAGNNALHYVANPITAVPYDYDGETRGAPKTDIGADEMFNAVPVTMLSLKGARINSINNLSWTTLTEINNRGFELQRSADGTNFDPMDFIATQAANGNSSLGLNYKYEDVAPLPGINYYRLKQIDIDGRFAYSNIVSIQPVKTTTLTLTSVYPNPVISQLTIKVASPVNDMITLMVSDLAGRVVLNKSMQVGAGDNNLALDVSAFPSGVYMLKAVCGNGCESGVIKFEKQ